MPSPVQRIVPRGFSKQRIESCTHRIVPLFGGIYFSWNFERWDALD